MPNKKILTAFDPARPSAKSSDFVVPIIDGGTAAWLGLKSKSTHRFGMVVFVGRELTANDVFARLVDTGRKIDDVNRCLAGLASYLDSVSKCRLGDVFGVVPGPQGFELVPTDLRP